MARLEGVKNDQERRRFQCQEEMTGDLPVGVREQEGALGGVAVVAGWVAVGLDLSRNVSVLIVATE
jgi:hypothetical protein